MEAGTGSTAPYEGWGVVEVMGHRRRAGYVREVQLFGTTLLRIDIPMSDDGNRVVELYGGAAIFSLVPCDQATAELVALDCEPEPLGIWTLERSLAALAEAKEAQAKRKAEEEARAARYRERYGERGDLDTYEDSDDEEDHEEDPLL